MPAVFHFERGNFLIFIASIGLGSIDVHQELQCPGVYLLVPFMKFSSCCGNIFTVI